MDYILGKKGLSQIRIDSEVWSVRFLRNDEKRINFMSGDFERFVLDSGLKNVLSGITMGNSHEELEAAKKEFLVNKCADKKNAPTMKRK